MGVSAVRRGGGGCVGMFGSDDKLRPLKASGFGSWASEGLCLVAAPG